MVITEEIFFMRLIPLLLHRCGKQRGHKRADLSNPLVEVITSLCELLFPHLLTAYNHEVSFGCANPDPSVPRISEQLTFNVYNFYCNCLIR